MKANGSIERFKARLVAKRYSQIEDINNAFLNGDLDEEMYMSLPPGYQVKREYLPNTKLVYNGGFVTLLVYVDDIIIDSNNLQLSMDVKTYLSSHFKLKDLGEVKYFLGLELARSIEGISICQRKYALDMLEEHGLLGVKPVSTPIYYNHKLEKATDDEQLADATLYRQLIRKLISVYG
ncbi:PREDICTED: uncharacterized mitochondrial protein AtMg00810-like [Theobroma cacao]|uniref:Uncharacterized mitochondrial protein AtMg00810-like n=1 Tax=Theobroma cacao TaxID=3641 RepID=A0AB32VSP8_THECC|nr:PREDICTED: uncharacterized mitochondrial protein AtMg00810-like [Theobroma cacao]